MKDKIYDNDYITVNMDNKSDTMEIHWKKECGNIVNDGYQAEQMRIKQIVDDHQPEKLLVDMVDCVYHISPGSGPWYEHTLFSMYAELSPNRIALLVPRNLFAHAFFDAARAQEKTDYITRFQYFNDPDQAREWLDTVKPPGS